MSDAPGTKAPYAELRARLATLHAITPSTVPRDLATREYEVQREALRVVDALLADRDRLAKIVDEVRALIDSVEAMGGALVSTDRLRAILSGEGK